MNKKITFLVLGLFLLSGCSFTNQEKSSAFKVGVLLPLSGSMSKAGSDVQVALEIAKEDFTSNIELIYEDDQFKPHLSVNGFTKLKNIDNVSAIIGPLNGSSIESIRPLTQKNKLIAITPWGAANTIDTFLLKNSHEVKHEVSIILNHILQKRKKTNPAILYMENDFGLLHAQEFSKQLKKHSATLATSESFLIGQQDFRSELTKIKASDADALYIVHNGAWNAKIARQAKEIGLDIDLYGMYAAESSDLLSVAQNSLEGFIYTYTIDQNNVTEKQQKFIHEFRKRQGGDPQASAYNAYDIYGLLSEAFEICSHDSLCISDHIQNNTSFEGVSGNFEFNYPEVKRDFFLKEIKNNTITSAE